MERYTEPARTLRLVQAVRAVAHEIWNLAIQKKVTQKQFPGQGIAKGTPKNLRTKFFSVEEVEGILSELRRRSIDVYHYTMLSLYTGLRAGDLFSMTWGDLEQGVARDTKNGETVPIPFLNSVHSLVSVISERKAMFPHRRKSDFVFAKADGSKREQVSKTFFRVLDDLQINRDVTDRRGRACFHTLQHTFASWLVQNGIPLFSVGELMGQKSAQMTKRYSHLGNQHFAQAAEKLNSIEIKQPEATLTELTVIPK